MRVALVHDWLTGMRGGEKCLEIFCELFPLADLYTLLYAPEKVSPTIRQMKVKVLLSVDCRRQNGSIAIICRFFPVPSNGLIWGLTILFFPAVIVLRKEY